MSNRNAINRTRGSRNFLDTLFWWRRPHGSDIDALSAGEDRQMSCHIRSNIPALPHKFSYGLLYVKPDGLVWQRYLKRKDMRQIPLMNGILQVRNVSKISEWNIKQALFKIVVAEGPDGVVEMAVPNGDVPVLRSWIEGRHVGPGMGKS